MAQMSVSFPGGKRVDAEYNGFTIRTDQSPRGGGEGSAPQPFDLFLASIATCAGIYVKGFCDSRNIDTQGLSVEMEIVPDPVGHRIGKLELNIVLPASFPARFKDAVIRSAELCAVKQHLHNPPEIVTRATLSA
ncbi:MAG: OsmC family protein [Candidatus Delongbacteria bacterium]